MTSLTRIAEQAGTDVRVSDSVKMGPQNGIYEILLSLTLNMY